MVLILRLAQLPQNCLRAESAKGLNPCVNLEGMARIEFLLSLKSSITRGNPYYSQSAVFERQRSDGWRRN